MGQKEQTNWHLSKGKKTVIQTNLSKERKKRMLKALFIERTVIQTNLSKQRYNRLLQTLSRERTEKTDSWADIFSRERRNRQSNRFI